MLEELWDAMQMEETVDYEHSSNTNDEDSLSLSVAATEGIRGKKTMKLQGLVNQQHLLILIDSVSSNTFISHAAVERLQCTTQPTAVVAVTATNGEKLPSTEMVPQVTWWTQGHTFSTPARVLDLTHYGMILGMDWLEQYNPMWVHWKKKKMRFTHQGKRITLVGVKDCTSSCQKLPIQKLKGY